MFKTFRPGGIHPSENKLTAGSEIRELPVPGQVSSPLNQHIGASPRILVEKGDMVKVGQLIAEGEGFISANIHSSVSGKVLKVDAVVDISGYKRKAITIKVEGDEWGEEIDRSTELVREISLERHEIVQKINKSGIVGIKVSIMPPGVRLPDDIQLVDFEEATEEAVKEEESKEIEKEIAEKTKTKDKK